MGREWREGGINPTRWSAMASAQAEGVLVLYLFSRSPSSPERSRIAACPEQSRRALQNFRISSVLQPLAPEKIGSDFLRIARKRKEKFIIHRGIPRPQTWRTAQRFASCGGSIPGRLAGRPALPGEPDQRHGFARTATSFLMDIPGCSRSSLYVPDTSSSAQTPDPY